ncbi:MAG: hypothetical protein M3Z66_10715, partial [Chloroflexota bacterium]|nr:hypothetical protein [Chloroflexota bacterium]
MDRHEVELGELREEEFPAAASLVARAMRDLPYASAIWGTDVERRERGLLGLMRLYLPRMQAAALAARRRETLVGIVGLAPPGTCIPRLGDSL